MRSRILLVVFGLLAMFGVAAPAWAGSPHFVDGTVVATADGATLTVSGKEAGLGDEAQIHIVVTADAQCINPGGNAPQAGNKQSVQAAADFPVQNGQATWELTLTAVFQPPCSPPMSVVWSNIVVTDTTNGISTTLAGATTLAAAVSPLSQSGASCRVDPHPLHVLQYGTLSAVGLPTTGVVALYTYFTYDGIKSAYGEVDITVNPDGTYQQTIQWSSSGKADYEFVDDMSGTTLAACNVLLSGAGGGPA